MDTAVAVAHARFGNVSDPLAKRRLVGPLRAIAVRSPIEPQAAQPRRSLTPNWLCTQ